MIGSVIRASWMNLRRDRAALVLSFLVPIVFFSIFATVFGNTGARGAVKVKVAWVDEDQSAISKGILSALQAETALKVILLDDTVKPPRQLNRGSARARLREGKFPTALIVPRGFGAGGLAFGPTRARTSSLLLLADTSDPIAPEVVQGLLQKSVMTGMPLVMIDAGVKQLGPMIGGFSGSQKEALESNRNSLTNLMSAPGSSGSASGAGSLVPVQVEDVLGEKKKNPLIAFYAAGIGVMFLLFAASGAGGALLEERESGTLDRVLGSRVSLSQFLAGKFLYLAMLGSAQLTLMFLWGALVFGVELFSHLGGFVIMTLATACATSAFGLLLAAVCRTRSQLSAVTTLTVLTLSALGGNMFPPFLMSDTMRKLSLITFNAWALEGFQKVFWREEPIQNLWPQVTVLLVVAALLFAAAKSLTRRWELD